MGKLALLLVAALTLRVPAALGQTAPPAAPDAKSAPVTAPAPDAGNHVTGFTAWDDDYFYIALQINKPALNGKNRAPYSHPLEDDAAILSIQTDNDSKSVRRTAKTVTIAASAVGGIQLYSGANATPLFGSYDEIGTRLADIAKNEPDPAAQQTKRAALLGSILKYSVTPKGGARLGGLNSPGYTLEIAIPWSDLGGRPEAGTRLGFNIAAQSVVPGSPALQSLSTLVRATPDLDNPSLWGQIVLSNAPNAAKNGALVSPRVFASKPVIDGDLASGEWNTLSRFDFGETLSNSGSVSLANTRAARVRPDFTPRPPRPALPLAAPAAPSASPAPRAAQNVTPLVMARYEYWYQADPRKAAPTAHVTRGDGSTELAQHPLEGVGPWFSYDRADWHRGQLRDLRRAGIDVILPYYRGASRDRQLYAAKGLTVLTTTLRALQQAGQDYPQVGLYLDASALAQIVGDQPDLREPAAQAALYGLIRDFYQSVPAAFRCVVATEGQRAAYPVVLSDASGFKDFDGSFATYARQRFAGDFDGADLIIVGAENFRAKAKLDGYLETMREPAAQNGAAKPDGDAGADGWLKVAAIRLRQPAAPPETSSGAANATDKPHAAPRAEDAYRDDWMRAIARRPSWILLDSWNDYTAGTAIAPTMEGGYSLADLTKVYSHVFAGTARLNAKFVWHDAPAAMLSGQTYRVNLRVQNAGLAGWSPTPQGEQTSVAFGYRWRRMGEETVVATGDTVPLAAPALSGENASVSLPVRAANGLAALPEGAYTLEIAALPGDKKGAATAWPAPSANSLRVPVSVRTQAGGSLPEWGATLVRTDLPLTLENGSVYTVGATLRNDGAMPWRKTDHARLTLRLARLNALAGSDSLAARENPVVIPDATAELTEDVPPGQETTVKVALPVMDADGQPLPVWTQEDLWTYGLAWEVAADGPRTALVQPASVGDPVPSGFALAGVRLPAQPVAVVDFDFGARFTSDGTPPNLPVERRQPVRLSLQNVGPQTWKKDQVRVGYHWYYQDGSEFLWEDETTPLPQDVAPGQRAENILAWVTAPPFDGNYTLVWDVKVGDTWSSTMASARPYDLSARAVQTIGGRLIFADLAKAYNIDGVSDSDDPADGDLDNQGRTFPGVLTPPFANAPVTPSALWLPNDRLGPESPRRISFKWGPKDPKDKNFIACQGQRVDLGKSSGQCRRLHIVAASTGRDISTELKLIFQEPTSESQDLYAFSVSRWDRPPTHGEEVALLARYHHEKTGAQAGAVALYHYVITIREPRKLVALQLPLAPELKIAAITLEK